MPDRDKTFLDRLVERLDAIDSSSIQAYILHLAREKGFLETIFNAVREGILVINRELKIRYHNHAAKELLGLPDDLSRLRVSNFLLWQSAYSEYEFIDTLWPDFTAEELARLCKGYGARDRRYGTVKV